MTGFQKNVYTQPSPGVEGAWASSNPPVMYVAGDSSLVSGASGVTVGRFAWATAATGPNSSTFERADNNALLVANGVARTPSGFAANLQQGLTTTYLAESGMTMLPYQAMSLFTRGDFWAKAIGAGAARPQQIFANLLDGTIQAATSGTTVAALSYTASFATTVMTVTVAAASALKVGMSVVGAGVPANTFITSFGTGTGGTGTYNLSTTPGTIGAQATTSSEWIETAFKALSTALVNEIVKIGHGS